jgi:hypothetical protein
VVYLILLQLLMIVVQACLSCIPHLLKLLFDMKYFLGCVANDPFYLSTNVNKLYFALNKVVFYLNASWLLNSM